MKLAGFSGISWDTIIYDDPAGLFSLALEHGLKFKNGPSRSVTYHDLPIAFKL
jgi:hypothetical protein